MIANTESNAHNGEHGPHRRLWTKCELQIHPAIPCYRFWYFPFSLVATVESLFPQRLSLYVGHQSDPYFEQSSLTSIVLGSLNGLARWTPFVGWKSTPFPTILNKRLYLVSTVSLIFHFHLLQELLGLMVFTSDIICRSIGTLRLMKNEIDWHFVFDLILNTWHGWIERWCKANEDEGDTSGETVVIHNYLMVDRQLEVLNGQKRLPYLFGSVYNSPTIHNVSTFFPVSELNVEY